MYNSTFKLKWKKLAVQQAYVITTNNDVHCYQTVGIYIIRKIKSFSLRYFVLEIFMTVAEIKM